MRTLGIWVTVGGLIWAVSGSREAAAQSCDGKLSCSSLTYSEASFFIENTSGNGSGALGINDNGTGGFAALEVSESGSQNAIWASNTNNANWQPVVLVTQAGPGDAVQLFVDGTAGSAINGTIESASNGSAGVYAATVGTGPGFQSYVVGTGNGVNAQINNAKNGSAAIYATTNGTAAGIQSYVTGIGNGVYAQISNASNGSTAIYATTNGTAPGIQSYVTGTGRGLYAQISNATNSSDAIYTTTNGSGTGLESYVTGTGSAIYAHINNVNAANIAVQVATNAGTGEGIYDTINNANNVSPALVAATDGKGAGVVGLAASNVGGSFTGGGTHGAILLVPEAKLTGSCPVSGEMYMSTEPHLYVCLVANTAWTQIK
jgi:hypothetical protein